MLRSLFQIQRGEERRALLMLLYSVAVVGGVVITGQTAARVLFLSALPPSAVPYLFILPPVALLASSAVLTRVTGRLRSDRLIIASYSLVLAGVTAFWLLLRGSRGGDFWVLCAFFVFIDVASSVAVLQFWTFAGEIFNSLEAKRLFGLISGGSTIANILFGALITTLADCIAPCHLIVVVMASLAVCILCVSHLGTRYSSLLAPPSQGRSGASPERGGSLLEDLRAVMRTPLVQTMSGILVLVAAASSIADYQLDLGLKTFYGGDGQGMASFLGRFRLWAGLGAGVLQFFLAGRLMSRFGLVLVLLLLPSAILAGAGTILLTGGLVWAAAIPRACDVVLKYPVNDPAFSLLFLPLQGSVRAKARAVLDGIVKPPVVMGLGLVFLWSGQSGLHTIVLWAYVVLALVVVWVALVLRAGRQYVAALSESIRFRRLDPHREKIDLTDESSIRVVRQTLRSAQPQRVIHALTLLPHIPSTDWTPDVALLLEHADPDVRILALRYLADHQAVIYAEEVVERLHDREERVRAAAVESLCALGGLRVLRRILPFLRDPSPRIRGAAVLGLIEHMGLDGFLHAGETLKALLESEDWRARLEAVRVLEALRVRSFYHPLATLMEDPSVDVQVAAIRAAGSIRAPELIPRLVRKLRSPATRGYATEALDRCLGDDLGRLERLLDEVRRDPVERRQLVYLLRRRPAPRAVQRLLAEMDCTDDELRGVALESLLELRDRGQSVPAGPMRRALERELRRGHELRVVRHDLHEVDVLIHEALTQRLERAKERILTALELLYPQLTHTWVGDTLAGSDARARATALELLENLLQRSVREQVVSLFGGTTGEALERAAQRLRIRHRPQIEHLQTLARCDDAWLRSCALHVVGEEGLVALRDVAVEALSSDDPVVRETAAVALLRLPRGMQQDGEDPLEKLAPALYETLKPQIDPVTGDMRMALSALEKVFFLKGVPLFEEIPGEDIVGMVPILHEVTIPKGETFIHEGDAGDALYIIVAGEVRIRPAHGAELTVRSREVIGERSVLTQQPRSADCTALTEVVALRIDQKDFWELISEQPKITLQILKVVVDRYM